MSTTNRVQEIASIAARLERLPMTSYQRNLFAVIATAWLFDSIDLGALTFLLGSIKAEFGLSLAEAGFLSSASFAGMFIGASTSGMLADKFGRKAIFQFSMIIWGAGALFCGLAPSVSALVVARVIVGIGMGMEFPVAQAIASELATAQHRGRYIALLEGCWPLGFIIAGLLTYLILPIGGWRAVFLVTAIPALFVFVVRRNIPESPRWLADQGRMAEAEAILETMENKVIAKLGGTPLPPLPAIEIKQPPSARMLPLAELWSKAYAKRTLMVWLMWFFALLGYYGLTTWLSALLQEAGYSITKSVLYIVGISLAGIPGFLTSAWLIEKWGRKPTAISAFLGSAIAAYLYGNAGNFTWLITCGCLMQFFLFGMWSVLYAYTPELYPTRARATGSGWASAVGRIGSLIGPPVVGLILPISGQSAVFAFGAGAFVLAASAVLVLGEETKGRVVEEISQ